MILRGALVLGLLAAVSWPRLVGALDLTDPRDHPWKEAPAAASDGEIRSLGFDPDVVELVATRTGRKPELLPGPGAVAPIGLAWTADSVDAEPLARSLRTELRKKGYTVFLTERGYGMGPDRIGLVKTLDRFAPVALRGTEGRKAGLETKDVVRRLQQWNEKTPLEVVGAGPDWVEIEFETVPSDVDALAEEIRTIAPDSVSGDPESLLRFKSEIRRTRRVLLFWE